MNDLIFENAPRHAARTGRTLQKRPLAVPPGFAAVDSRFEVHWARNALDVLEAQRLRYRVFVGEMGAQLTPPPSSPHGYDIDRFDAFCEHLLVRTVGTGGEQGDVIGTYRVLTPAAVRHAGGLYTETEFNLGGIVGRLDKAVELGRSCVHPHWRAGGVVMALWGALGEFMLANELDTMVGCASISVLDGGHGAASLWARLRQTHLAEPHWQVVPHVALPVDQLRQDLEIETPALLKGYLRCGAKVLGPPAWDPEFRTADLPLLMHFDLLPERYQRHFLRR